MKLTESIVHKLEHNLIRDMDVFTASGDEEARDLTMFIAGVNAMAQAVIEAMREVKNV